MLRICGKIHMGCREFLRQGWALTLRGNCDKCEAIVTKGCHILLLS
jgi:hypothetical protein